MKINTKNIIFSKTYPHVAAIQHCIRILMISCFAFFLSDRLKASQSDWIIFSALFLAQIRLGTRLLNQVGWMWLLGEISLSLIWVSGYLGDNIYFWPIYLGATSFFAVVIGLIYPQFFLPACLINLLSFLSGGIPADLQLVNERCYFAGLGVGIVIIANMLLWPRSINRYFFSTFSCCLDSIRGLQKIFLEIYIKRDYQEKLYLYEKKIHRQNIMVLYFINKLQWLLTTNPVLESETKNLQAVMRLHELAIAQGYLRFRVQDFATFEIIARELNDLITIEEVNEEAFNNITATIEELYHSTLQIIAAEPLAFLMFIQAIKDFNDELVNLKNG